MRHDDKQAAERQAGTASESEGLYLSGLAGRYLVAPGGQRLRRLHVAPDTNVTDVAVLMADYNLTTIPVVDADRRILASPGEGR